MAEEVQKIIKDLGELISRYNRRARYLRDIRRRLQNQVRAESQVSPLFAELQEDLATVGVVVKEADAYLSRSAQRIIRQAKAKEVKAPVADKAKSDNEVKVEGRAKKAPPPVIREERVNEGEGVLKKGSGRRSKRMANVARDVFVLIIKTKKAFPSLESALVEVYGDSLPTRTIHRYVTGLGNQEIPITRDLEIDPSATKSSLRNGYLLLEQLINGKVKLEEVSPNVRGIYHMATENDGIGMGRLFSHLTDWEIRFYG